MEYEVSFIEGKGVSTKSIRDRNITIFVNVPDNLFDLLRRYTNKPLTLIMECGDIKLDFTCSIADTSSAISYSKEHGGMVKLDVIIDDELVIGYILKGKLTLKLK